MSLLRSVACLLALAVPALAACSPGDQPTIIVEGSACSDNDYGPALDNYVASMDANNDGVVNSDEFNTAFQEAEDNDDGRLDITEMQNAVCSP